MANLRGVHVLSVTQYEEEMSRFRLGLCSLRVKGFSTAPLRLCYLSLYEVPRKQEIEIAGDCPVSLSCMCRVSVMEIKYTYRKKYMCFLSRKPVKWQR